ncbi:hypothetical protein PTTG_05263 [Puccinia triticina 1-1 BBBD Race 1]|uniref:Origin recognition complex subunit 2 n=1 Tax=Puccinia triticina (isolate 1-1 / race 1 (BBBD)) TaxID=630390 RepID=A0A180G6I7_PUCT1|nr:hypothetical protein PTTG_05263 [Puccinia triticina 1-1 BBBD Race 1]
MADSSSPPAEAHPGFLRAENPADAYLLAHGRPAPSSASLFSASRPRPDSPLPLPALLAGFRAEPLAGAEQHWAHTTSSPAAAGRPSSSTASSPAATSPACSPSSTPSSPSAPPSPSPRTSSKPRSLEALEAHAARLCALLAAAAPPPRPPIAILLHNLDAPNFSHPTVLAILGLLASQPAIHLLASLDHIHAPLRLPTHLLAARPSSLHQPAAPPSFNALYHHLPTPTGYTLESLLSGTLNALLPPAVLPPTGLQPARAVPDLLPPGPPTVQATLHVLASLTAKAKALFRLLAEHQLQALNALPADLQPGLPPHHPTLPAPPLAISIPALFDRARSHFIVSALSQLHALLVEFRDHHIIRASTLPPPSHLQPPENRDQQEWIWIAFDPDQLELILAQIDSL